MTEYAYSIYEAVVATTSSELILFFVLLFIFLCVAVTPIYITTMRKRKEEREQERQHERERERHIIGVIQENSNVIADLKTTLELSGKATNTTLERVHTRIDEICTQIKEISISVAEIRTKHASILNCQNEVRGTIDKLFLIVERNNFSHITARNIREEKE